MAEGRIQNRTLLATVADELNLEGVKRFPAHLELGDVKVVVDLGRFMDAAVNPPQFGTLGALYTSGTVALGGLTDEDFEIFQAADVNAQILALSLEFRIPIDAAPAGVQLQVYYELPVGQPFYVVNIFNAFYTAAGAASVWRFGNGGYDSEARGVATAQPTNVSWVGFIQPQVPLRVRVSKANTGIAFPALSEVDFRLYTVTWPVGTLKPF